MLVLVMVRYTNFGGRTQFYDKGKKIDSNRAYKLYAKGVGFQFGTPGVQTAFAQGSMGCIFKIHSVDGKVFKIEQASEDTDSEMEIQEILRNGRNQPNIVVSRMHECVARVDHSRRDLTFEAGCTPDSPMSRYVIPKKLLTNRDKGCDKLSKLLNPQNESSQEEAYAPMRIVQSKMESYEGDIRDLDANLLDLNRLEEDMSKALTYVHSVKVCHRDIKPDNIYYYFNNTRVVYALADFGLATRLTSRGAAVSKSSWAGTLHYMNRRDLRCVDEGGNSGGTTGDKFALGATLIAAWAQKHKSPNPLTILFDGKEQDFNGDWGYQYPLLKLTIDCILSYLEKKSLPSKRRQTRSQANQCAQIHNVLGTMDQPTRMLIQKYYNSVNAQ